MNALTLKYELSVDDVVNFNYAHWKSPFSAARRKKQLIIAITYLVLAMVGLAVLLTTSQDKPSEVKVILMVSTAVLLVSAAQRLLFTKIAIRSKVHRQLEHAGNRNILLPGELFINEESIRNIDSVSDTTYNWNAITRSLENGKYFFLYINSNNAVIVAKRNLSEEEKAILSKLVQTKISAGHIFTAK